MMAKNTQQHLFLCLAGVYSQAIEKGATEVSFPLGWVAEILEYLDAEDAGTHKVVRHLDDYTPAELEEACNTKPKAKAFKDMDDKEKIAYLLEQVTATHGDVARLMTENREIRESRNDEGSELV